MFPSFLSRNKTPETPEPTPAPAKAAAAPHPLDGVTGGAFSAATSGERAAKVREWLATNPDDKIGSRCRVLKSNRTDNDSAKMATGKGVIQGYAAQAAVDSAHQIIVAADVSGSGSEQGMLLPMVEASKIVRDTKTLITADAGYHSEANLKALAECGINALIADNQMRERDTRFAGQARHRKVVLHDKRGTETKVRLYRPQDFQVADDGNSATCPAGAKLYSNGSGCRVNGREYHKYTGSKQTCGECTERAQCLRFPDKTPVRQVAIFKKGTPGPLSATEAMKRRIDSDEGRRRYGQRIGTVEPVFGNLRHNKRLNRFTLRGHGKVGTQWRLYCLVHNIEKLARVQLQ